MKKKQLHQVKTKWYYIFWGICTLTVLLGQIYVGSGYRIMSDSVLKLTDSILLINE